MVLGWVGVSLEYPKVGLLAISRDISAYLQDLYVMVNSKLTHENEARMRIVFFILYIIFYMCVKEAFS